ncbi:MAG: hypothetical protein JWP74_2037 [Marmoricola sp.]|nr:hypothetical protein [Marmoricola sp.]
MSTFPPDVVAGVLAHMNGDHADDSLRIIQAFGLPTASAAEMTWLDSDAGYWSATVGDATREVRIPWPAAPITERSEIRHEVVALHEQACAALGVSPPRH